MACGNFKLSVACIVNQMELRQFAKKKSINLARVFVGHINQPFFGYADRLAAILHVECVLFYEGAIFTVKLGN